MVAYNIRKWFFFFKQLLTWIADVIMHWAKVCLCALKLECFICMLLCSLYSRVFRRRCFREFGLESLVQDWINISYALMCFIFSLFVGIRRIRRCLGESTNHQKMTFANVFHLAKPLRCVTCPHLRFHHLCRGLQKLFFFLLFWSPAKMNS